MRVRKTLVWLMVAMLGFLFVGPGTAVAAPFDPGNIVVLRLGDGSGTLGSTATPVFLDEYTTAGDFVQTIALPTAVADDNRILTMSGTATSEGSLTLSADRNYLALAGYDAPVGTSGITGANSETINRIVGRVDINGVVDTSTRINDAYNGSNIRSVVTDDGTRFWTAGNSSGSPATGGVRLVNYASTGATSSIATAPNNARWVAIFRNQLYLSSGSGGNTGINTVGTGLPTTSGQSSTRLVDPNNAYGFVLFDLNESVPGVDTLYVANQSSPGLRKFSFDGTDWTARGHLTDALTDITAIRTVSGVDLYVTVGTGAGNTIYRVSDTAAFNNDITNSGMAVTAAGTLIATAGANTVFRGIAFTPGSPAQVAPTAVSLATFSAATNQVSTPLILLLLLIPLAGASLFFWRRAGSSA